MERIGALTFLLTFSLTLLTPQGAHAFLITPDGDPSEWSAAVDPLHANQGIIRRTSASTGIYVWDDAAGDTRTDLASPENAADIQRFAVTTTPMVMGFLIELGEDVFTGDNAPQIQIAIDLDRGDAATNTGTEFFAGFADTTTRADAKWDILIKTRFGSGDLMGADVLDSSFAVVDNAFVAVSGSTIEIAVPTGMFPIAYDAARFTVATFRSTTGDDTKDVSGSSDALDCISHYGDPAAAGFPNTWDEVSDGVIDYSFDLHFAIDGEIHAPLVVSAFLSDDAATEEFITVRNELGVSLDLTGYKLGDEEEADAGEGMLLFPPDTVASGGMYVTAKTATDYNAGFGVLPDAEWGSTIPAVPSMADYAPWATGSVALSNGGDHLIILDPSDTILDVVIYGSQSYPGIVDPIPRPGGDVIYERGDDDTDDCDTDFSDASGGCVDDDDCDACEVCGAGDVCEEVDCSAFDMECAVGVCDAAADACTSLPQPDGTMCTVMGAPGMCMSGVCVDACDGVMATDCSTPMVNPATGMCELVETAGACSGLDTDCQEGVCDVMTGCDVSDRPDGTACDDGDVCSTADACMAGACVGGAPLDCDDANDCTDDTCGPGGCMNTAAPAGTSCDDGNGCTTGDVCGAGVCAGSGGPDCDDGNPCTADSCDPVVGCTNVSVADGVACDDGDACTTGDSCVSGACAAGSPTMCAGDACNSGSCNPVTGACELTPTNEGGACDDTDVCTVTDVCTSGVCVGSGALPCDDSNACTDDSCVAGSGCTFMPVADGAACDDGDSCTSMDVCTSGTCGGMGGMDCDDGNPCTADSCDPVTGCGSTPVADGTACDDGDACTTMDVCAAGACGGMPGSACDDGNPCTADSCDPATGCVADPVVDGTACDDGDACTSMDMCAGGTCAGAGGLDCDDGNPCTADSCDPITGCGNTAVADGTACDDGDPCTESDMCSAGVCSAAPKDCSALDDMCSVGSCNAVTGICGAVARPDGTSCDDGDLCTGGDQCTGGTCEGAVTDCSALTTSCRVGVCDGATGACAAMDVADGTSCDDGDGCTESDSCSAGACGGSALDCSGVADACNVGSCDPALGCVATPRADGTACSDADPCTTSDMCSAGSCVGTARDCSGSSDACNVGACDPGTGACTGAPRPDGTACDDGVLCTVDDACGSGACAGDPTDCSAAADACNAGLCDPATGTCGSSPLADGTACDDTDLCTVSDACTAGACEGAPRDCDDGDPCTVNACDPATGACTTMPAADGIACDDGNACTTGDVCGAGVCSGSIAPGGSACGDDCNSGTCDPGTGRCVQTPINEGGACDDGDLCTVSGVCNAGACDSSPRDCSGEADDCNTGVCNPVSGACEPMPIADGTSCGDGDACTVGDVCAAGVCAGSARDCSALDDMCNVGSCDATGACVASPRPDGSACDDGVACTMTDVCTAGACGGSATDCSAFDDPCNVGICDPVTGACGTTPRMDGAACDDGDGCTESDACLAGTCAGTALDCSGLTDACLVGTCDPALGRCGAVPRADGSACDDEDPCTGMDVCSSGVCGGTATDCSALTDGCNVGRCDASGACVTDPVADGTACDDGNACTAMDACSAGACVGEASMGGSDCGDDCNEGVCEAATGECRRTPINEGGACEDADMCTEAGTCSAGICAADPVDCSTLDGPCVVGMCDAESGCVAMNRPDGEACDDGLACTSGDTCTGGECIPTATDCGDAGPDAGVDAGTDAGLDAGDAGDAGDADVDADVGADSDVDPRSEWEVAGGGFSCAVRPGPGSGSSAPIWLGLAFALAFVRRRR